MLLPLPRSTLFPYTTLFRSADQTVNEDAGAQSLVGFASGMSAGPADESGQTLDRKSTRLNSSHVSTSYAVVASTDDMSYTPAPNANGSALVSVVLKDNGGTA